MCLISRVMDYYGIKTTDKNLVHTTCLPVCLSAQWPSVPSKIDCKETNGYTAANIKPDLGATTPSTPSMTGWGAGAPVRPAVCTPDMTRYTPSTADQVARDRAWMNTCSSLASQAAQVRINQDGCKVYTFCRNFLPQTSLLTRWSSKPLLQPSSRPGSYNEAIITS